MIVLFIQPAVPGLTSCIPRLGGILCLLSSLNRKRQFENVGCFLHFFLLFFGGIKGKYTICRNNSIHTRFHYIFTCPHQLLATVQHRSAVQAPLFHISCFYGTSKGGISFSPWLKNSNMLFRCHKYESCV